MRTLMLVNLARFYHELDSADLYLEDEVANRVLTAAENVLVLYSALATNAMEANKFKYSIVNKHHMFWHLADGARFCNPRMLWCYMAEDFMRVMAKVGSAALMGGPTLALSAKVTQRWCIGRYFDIERGLDT
eukprot:9474836-Pyramimonas_sp.AAC.1